MRPTKEDYDRYIWLVQQGRAQDWNADALKDNHPFCVADPTMTFILLRGLMDLVTLAKDLGEDVSALSDMEAQVRQGVDTLWNPDISCYAARDVNSGIWSDAITNAAFLCWYAKSGRPEVEAHLKRILDTVAYGVPSLDPSDPRLDAKRYWRGPTWAIMNQMIGTGLIEAGLPLGPRLRDTTREMIARHGKAEYFDPLTGAPAGGGTFTWTAAVWLSWANAMEDV